MDNNENNKKTGFCEAIDSLPFWLKLIFCIPALDIIWAIYRIIKGVETSNAVLIVVGILWIFPGSVICWLVDIVTMLINGKPILT